MEIQVIRELIQLNVVLLGKKATKERRETLDHMGSQDHQDPEGNQ